MYDVARHCDMNYVRSSDAQKQLARTFLSGITPYRIVSISILYSTAFMLVVSDFVLFDFEVVI